jgi:hypothetical protein
MTDHHEKDSKNKTRVEEIKRRMGKMNAFET